MHHQTDEQSSRSEKWQKFSDNLEYAWQLVNASGRRAAAVMETTARVKCRIGYDGGLTTWISAKQIPEVNYHISWIMTKISIMRRTSCSSLSRVLSTCSSCSTSPTSPTSSSQDYEKFYNVSSNNTKWEYEWTSTGKPVTPWIATRKRVTGKEFALISERPNLRNAGRQELLGHYANAQVKPHLEQQNSGELITAEHKVLIETCESGNNRRYAIVWQNVAAQRSATKQNFLEPTRKPKVIYTDNSWNLAFMKSFALLLQSTNQRSKLVETTKT